MAYTSKKASIRHAKMSQDEVELACRMALDNSMGGPGTEIA